MSVGGAPGTRPPLSRRARWRNRIVAVTVLVTVWMLMWGVFSWANLVTGFAVAAVVLTVFPLPAVTFAGRLRPVGLLRFGGRFLGDLVVASAQLAWTAFRFGYRPHSAVIGVRLAVNSDLNLTLCGEAVSLVPGSLIVDTDRVEGVLYIHVFDVTSPADVERFRHGVRELEARIVRAVGSAAELELITSGGPATPYPPHRRGDRP